MRPNKLRELLKSNKPTLSTHIHTTWASVAEAIGHTSLYDYVEFVGEYGPFDLHDLQGFPTQRAIGSGFHSILFADCRSAADVSACASCARRPRRTEEPTAWSPRRCPQSFPFEQPFRPSRRPALQRT